MPLKKQCQVCGRVFNIWKSRKQRSHFCSVQCRYTPKTPAPTWQAEGVQVYLSDCLELLKKLPSNSVDSIVTDPPAGIGFLQKEWDTDKGSRENWIAWMRAVAYECLRVLKPGGHALVWAFPRTSHWTATAWEDAGWEVRDRISHAYASGFPKGVNLSKAIDKALGVEPTVVRSKGKTNTRRNRIEDLGFQTTGGKSSVYTNEGVELFETKPTSNEAREWDGWNNLLKPAIEDWWLFRKPLDGTLVQNVLKWGVGGLNIKACGVPRGDKLGVPAHFVLSDVEEYLELFPVTKTARSNRGKLLVGQHGGLDGKEPRQKDGTDSVRGYTDSGSAARYFPQIPRVYYCPKASSKDKNEGCDNLALKQKWAKNPNQARSLSILAHAKRTARNAHPTVKPTPLMRWLVTLITPPNGIVLDPFSGSGSTGKAAILTGCQFIGIEASDEYFPTLVARLQHARQLVREK